MYIKEFRGLKYPDEYFIKFFFKFNLHNKSNLTFLELGCSNGCNLTLPYQYNNNVIGVDLNDELINFANSNFSKFEQTNSYKFYSEDMRVFCDTSSNTYADVLVLANSIYYISKNDFIVLLRNIKKNNHIKSEIPFFIRFREIDDFRNLKGIKVDDNSYVLENNVTGEDGVFCKFYDTNEILQLLKSEFNIKTFDVMSIKYENIQNNVKVNNSDVVIWGIIN